MNDFGQAFVAAFHLMIEFDPDLLGIVALSLQVSLTATLLAAIVGLILGGAVALYAFPGRGIVKALLNAFMGLPPVVVGLSVYLLLSRSGPLGELGILFTPKAMIMAQMILVMPIIAALARQTIADLDAEYRDQLTALNTGPLARLAALLWDGRFTLLTVVLAGFGRAIAEVGAVIIVGGNIAHVTRVMTTTIALETSKGNLSLALALGIILISITLIINFAAMNINDAAVRRYG